MTEQARFVTASAAGEAFRAALAVVRPRAAGLTDRDLTLLRERLCAAVEEMRLAGISRDQAVVVVKGVATDSGLHWTSIELIERLASWCAEHYAASRPEGPASA